MTESTRQEKPLVIETEAVVIGAGLSGIAAAIHLVRGGFRVLCIEQRAEISNIIGESLDWSAPDLLANLGLPMEELISTEAATWKRHITVTRADCDTKEFLPGAWLADSPWNVEVRTLHLDRDRTDARLREIARRLGVTILNEHVADFSVLDESDAQARRVLGLRTAQGTFVRAAWFIDASGGDASLLGRRFDLKSVAYGPRKVAMWAHLPTKEWVEGTTLYMVSTPGAYMEWIWEIPIRPGVSSIGYVATGSSVKTQRAAGHGTQDIFARQCGQFPRLRETVGHTATPNVATTTFLCRTYTTVCGTNWVILGEAASQSDPITGNGVTAALRHADEATALIRRYRQRGTIPVLARAVYNLRVASVGSYFNSLIEKLFYQPTLRDRLGLFGTARIYTVPAWLMNLIYTRVRPAGSLIRTLAIASAMGAIRMITWFAFRFASILHRPAARQRQRQTISKQETAMRSNSRGKGEAVLLVHGMPTNGRLWDGVVHELARHFQCIVIDLPGMGGTPLLPYSADYFRQVAAQIEQIRIRHRVQHWHIVGHDAGCAIAVYYAQLFPKRVDCLALLSPAVFPDLQPFFLLEMLRKPVLGETIAPLVHALFWRVAMRRALPDPLHASQRTSFQRTFSGLRGPWKLMKLVRWGRPEVVLDAFPSILRELACPALVIHGSRDVLPDSFARRAAQLIANSHLLEMDSGHFIPIERASEVADNLLAYFTSRGAEIAASTLSSQTVAAPEKIADGEFLPVAVAQ